MIFPAMTALTAGIILIMQMFFALTVSGARSQNNVWVGDGGSTALLRTSRRHANLAENAAIFLLGFTLLEVSQFNQQAVAALCAAFVAARLFHGIGLSRENTNNVFRLIGGVGTYLIGFALGGLLIWKGSSIL